MTEGKVGEVVELEEDRVTVRTAAGHEEVLIRDIRLPRDLESPYITLKLRKTGNVWVVVDEESEAAVPNRFFVGQIPLNQSMIIGKPGVFPPQNQGPMISSSISPQRKPIPKVGLMRQSGQLVSPLSPIDMPPPQSYGQYPAQAVVSPPSTETFSVGSLCLVLKVDGQMVNVLVNEKSCKVPVTQFSPSVGLKQGNTAKLDLGNRWVVQEARKSIPRSDPSQLISARLEEIKLSEVVPAQSPLYPNSRVEEIKQPQVMPKPPFFPIPAQPTKPSNSLPISSLRDIYASQMTPSLFSIETHISPKFSCLYYSHGDQSGTRSIAAYLFQCLQFEKVMVTETPRNSIHLLSERLNYPHESLPPPQITLLQTEYEEIYGNLIDYIEKQLPGLNNRDFEPLCELLGMSLVLYVPTDNTNFEVKKMYPSQQWDKHMQKLTIIAKPPFPVLIPYKIAALMRYPLGICSVSAFAYIKKTRPPPKIDPILQSKLQKMHNFAKECEFLANYLLKFVSEIVIRFNEMLRNSELEVTFCGQDIGTGLHHLWELLVPPTDQVFPQLSPFIASFMSHIDSVYRHFTRLCSKCNRNYCHLVLDCGHYFCQMCIGEMINTASLQGVSITVSALNTGLYCPICSIAISSRTIERQDKDIFKRLSDQFANATNSQKCENCKEMRPKALTVKHCEHKNYCFFCVLKEQLYCETCAKWMTCGQQVLQTTVKCGHCSNQYYLNDIVPVMCSNMHVICRYCAYLGRKRGVCLVSDCKVSYTAEQSAVLEREAVVSCQCCGSSCQYVALVKTNCECVICIQCAGGFQRSSVCWYCQVSLPSESKSIGRISQCCWYCGQEGNTFALLCGDFVHEVCLKRYVTERSMQTPIQRVDCKQCGVEVLAQEIYNYLGSDLPQPYVTANPLESPVHCPSCSKLLASVSVSSTEVVPISCECGYMGCVLCLSLWDDHHSKGLCMMTLASSELEKLIRNKTPAIMCPNCRSVQPQSQSWQKCTECFQFFCSECGMLYATIEAHGPGYHRPDCSHHSPEVTTTEFVSTCPRCSHVGDAGCQAPTRLARRGYLQVGSNCIR